ncbi:MAG: hydantoinase B/oxoprolinase family protein, partial [Hydrogenothermus sp.]
FDKNGNLIAQAAHIPVHLGSMPMSVKSVIENVEFQEGDMVILNDPFKGGTHLPDITIVAPIFYDGELLFYVANRAHHADIGGVSAGSMPIAESIFQEGLIIPPVKLVKNWEIDKDVLNLIKNNVRTPQEREGDFLAQISANKVGINRLNELLDKYGKDTVLFYSNALLDYTEKIMKNFVKNIPDGIYSFTDYIEDDGLGNKDIKISVDITIKNDKVVVDFSKSDEQTKGSINAVKAITVSAVFYVFRSLIEEDIPTNAGALRPIEIITKKGTVVDATFPSSVSAGNVETSQRIVDVLLGALAEAIPDKVPSASQGTMNNITIGGISPKTNQPFTYYETIGGGMGASSTSDGESAVQSHMTNTLNTPIEALEFEFPFLITAYKIRKNSGGEGLHKGGDGIIREYQFLIDVEITVISERRKIPPYGLFGGKPALTGNNVVIKNGKKLSKEGKFQERLSKGDILRIETPGGGGFGLK